MKEKLIKKEKNLIIEADIFIKENIETIKEIYFKKDNEKKSFLKKSFEKVIRKSNVDNDELSHDENNELNNIITSADTNEAILIFDSKITYISEWDNYEYYQIFKKTISKFTQETKELELLIIYACNNGEFVFNRISKTNENLDNLRYLKLEDYDGDNIAVKFYQFYLLNNLNKFNGKTMSKLDLKDEDTFVDVMMNSLDKLEMKIKTNSNSNTELFFTIIYFITSKLNKIEFDENGNYELSMPYYYNEIEKHNFIEMLTRIIMSILETSENFLDKEKLVKLENDFEKMRCSVVKYKKLKFSKEINNYDQFLEMI